MLAVLLAGAVPFLMLVVWFDALSLGTRKKLLLAAGWIGAPQVLLLDEPSNGPDTAARDILAARIAADSAGRAICSPRMTPNSSPRRGPGCCSSTGLRCAPPTLPSADG